MGFLYFIVLVICNGLQLITEVKFVDTLVCFFPKHLSRTNRSLFCLIQIYPLSHDTMGPVGAERVMGSNPSFNYRAPWVLRASGILSVVYQPGSNSLPILETNKEKNRSPFSRSFFWLRYLDVCFCGHYLKLPFFISPKFKPWGSFL